MTISITDHHIYGQKVVASAGTAEKLDDTEFALFSLIIIAHDDNTGRIFYGASDVDSNTQKGLPKGASAVIAHQKSFKLSTIFLDSENDNEGCDFIGVRAI